MAGFKAPLLLRGCHHLDSAQVIVCTLADTYYKIAGTWVDGTSCNCGFSFDGSGKITYTEHSESHILFNGVSDVKADKVCQIYYALYMNGALVSGAETPVDFSSANSLRNISITNFVPLNKDDYIEIYVKSDTAATTVTSNTLFLTFLGERNY